MPGGRHTLGHQASWDFGQRSHPVGVHQRGPAWFLAHPRGFGLADEGVEKGGFADIGRAQDDDFGCDVVQGVVAEGLGGVEESARGGGEELVCGGELLDVGFACAGCYVDGRGCEWVVADGLGCQEDLFVWAGCAGIWCCGFSGMLYC